MHLIETSQEPTLKCAKNEIHTNRNPNCKERRCYEKEKRCPLGKPGNYCECEKKHCRCRNKKCVLYEEDRNRVAIPVNRNMCPR